MTDFSTVYVLSNPAMPGLIKIGYTTQDDIATRLLQLYSTGVPVPFSLEFACRVQNPIEVEAALHTAFSPHRINPKREFFRLEAEQAIAILKLLHTEDTTAQIASQPTQIDEESIAAAKTLRARRPKLNFLEMGIPIGATLVCVDNGATVTVASDKKVRLGDIDLFLTTATRQVLQLEYNVQPTPHWTYNSRLLSEIYEETYPESG